MHTFFLSALVKMGMNNTHSRLKKIFFLVNTIGITNKLKNSRYVKLIYLHMKGIFWALQRRLNCYWELKIDFFSDFF